MAVLGSEGYVRLRREAPDPIVVPASALRADLNTLQLISNDFWNGDEVYLITPNGLPLSSDALPEGVGCYFGSFYELGPNRVHVTAEDDEYYVSTNDSVFFYNRGTPVNTGTFFIYRDQLGRASFYTTRVAALAGNTSNRIDLKQLDFRFLIIAADGTSDYNNTLAECVGAAGEYRISDVTDEVTLKSICDFAPFYLQPNAGTAEYDNAELTPRRNIGGFPWIIQGQLREWSLELNGDNIDTTAVGQKFGENVKSVISGGGSFDFIVERDIVEDKYDSTSLMRLLFLTEKGSKAEAEFYMITDRAAISCTSSGYELAPGDLYYACEILITNTAINTRAEEFIVGTAQFVTTGSIELKMGQ